MQPNDASQPPSRPLRLKEKADRAVIVVVPIWFNWMGWVLALGVLRYLALKSSSPLLQVPEYLSYLLLAWYFHAGVNKFEMRFLPTRGEQGIRHLIAWMIVLFLLWGTWVYIA